MDDEIQAEIQHHESLIKQHRARQRMLEQQAASFGASYVPPHIALEIDELAAKIAACTAQIQQIRQTDPSYHITLLEHQIAVVERASRFFLVRSAPDVLETYPGEYQALEQWMETATPEIEGILGHSLHGTMVGEISGNLMTIAMRLRQELRTFQVIVKNQRKG